MNETMNETMKLQVLQENFKKSVNLTSHFISSKTQLPILGSILLKTSKSRLILSATNLENSISLEIPCKVEKEGEIAVNGKTLLDLLLNLRSGSLDIEAIKEQIKLTSLNFKANILGMNTSDFPKLPKIQNKNQINLKKEDLIKNLSKLLFSVSQDESRPVLTGVLFRFEKDILKLVSTDSFRLTEIKLKNEGKIKDFDVIIPKTILNELIKIEEESDIIFFYDLDNKQVFFKIGDITLSSKVIEGNFPDYQKIIPKTSEFEFFVDKEELDKAIKLASVFSRDSGNIVKLKTEKTPNLKILAESSSSGSQESEIEIRSEESEKSKETEIMFNYKYIEDVLKVIEDDEVKITITGKDSAAIFSDPKAKDFLHLIMPIKSQN